MTTDPFDTGFEDVEDYRDWVRGIAEYLADHDGHERGDMKSVAEMCVVAYKKISDDEGTVRTVAEPFADGRAYPADIIRATDCTVPHGAAGLRDAAVIALSRDLREELTVVQAEREGET